MKKRNLRLLLLIGLCLALFLGYRTVTRLRTDGAPPRITFTEETIALSALEPRDALLRGVTAADDHDGDVTASLVVESVKLTDPDGTIDVCYAAFDQAGNVTKAHRTARYTDYQRPRFYLNEPLLFSESTNFDILNVIGANDSLDGNIRHRIRATSLDGSSVAASGSHEVEFRVTNSLGDTTRLTLPVEVYPAGLYTLDLSLHSYLIYLEPGSDFEARQYLNSVTHNRETLSLRDGMPDGYKVKVSGKVDTQTPGVYPVDYTVTHTIINDYNADNNQISTGFSRLIVVVEG